MLFLFSLQCQISCNLTKFHENLSNIFANLTRIFFSPFLHIFSNLFLLYAYFHEKYRENIFFARTISYKQIFREQLPKSHLIKIFHKKLSLYFTFIFLRNFGKSKLFSIFTKIFAKLYHIFARKLLANMRGVGANSNDFTM
jgi:hypothetical protein